MCLVREDSRELRLVFEPGQQSGLNIDLSVGEGKSGGRRIANQVHAEINEAIGNVRQYRLGNPINDVLQLGIAETDAAPVSLFLVLRRDLHHLGLGTIGQRRVNGVLVGPGRPGYPGQKHNEQDQNGNPHRRPLAQTLPHYAIKSR